MEMDTSTTLARAKALPIRVEFKMHLVWEELREADRCIRTVLDRIYTPLSKSQEQEERVEDRRREVAEEKLKAAPFDEPNPKGMRHPRAS